MKRLIIISLSVITAVLAAKAAFAFNTDDKTMGSAASSQNFSDPDEKAPVTMHMNVSGTNNQNPGSSDPTTIHYEYDPTNGVYVPSTKQ